MSAEIEVSFCALMALQYPLSGVYMQMQWEQSCSITYCMVQQEERSLPQDVAMPCIAHRHNKLE